jgi:superoxide dismutase, Fe-Mn family
MTFELTSLPYAYEALEPYIDAKTMEIHHDKHHQAYVNNLNNALSKSDIGEESIEAILKNLSSYPVAVRNNAGGHYNHDLFWDLIKPGGSNTPSEELHEAIEDTFESFDKFKENFNAAATDRFGSGWAWLIRNESGILQICSTPNQDNPLMDVAEVKGYPILALDVWEHAYYLKYQNKRPDYIKAWWNVINWEAVSVRFDQSVVANTKTKQTVRK